MRKLLYFLAAVCLWTGCSDEYDDSAIKGDIDDLKDKVAALEQQIASLKQEATKINNDIAAMKAIADGIAITKVTENADGGYTVTFSDGKSYTIANGQKGDQGPQGPQGPEGAACTPMMRIDAEGYWQVSYDGGTTWEYPGGEKISALGHQNPFQLEFGHQYKLEGKIPLILCILFACYQHSRQILCLLELQMYLCT